MNNYFQVKSRCPFTHVSILPNKPSQFGIEFWSATDIRSNRSGAPLNGFHIWARMKPADQILL